MTESAQLGRFSEKYVILLVLQIEEIISFQQELSSPPRFRIQGGSPERDEVRTKDKQKSSCLILDSATLQTNK